MALRRASLKFRANLTNKNIEREPLALQSIDNIHGSDSLSGDMLHATTTSQVTNCSLGDSLDVVAEDFPVALGTSFSETFAFACLSTARHDELLLLEFS